MTDVNRFEKFQRERWQELELLSCQFIKIPHFAFTSESQRKVLRVWLPEWENTQHLPIGFHTWANCFAG